MEERQLGYHSSQSSSDMSDHDNNYDHKENHKLEPVEHEPNVEQETDPYEHPVTDTYEQPETNHHEQPETDIHVESERPYEMPSRPRLSSDTFSHKKSHSFSRTHSGIPYGPPIDTNDDRFHFSQTDFSAPSSLISIRRHCHESVHPNQVDKKARRQLVVASVLCLFFMIGEVVGGALAHSLAIMTDAAHLLTDFASFLISLLALYLGARPCTKKMSFGWYRAEVVGALTSVLLIWLVTGILVYLAVVRIIDENYEINSKIMLITSSIGVGVNIIMLFTLHDHGHSHGQSSASGPGPSQASGHGHSHGTGHGHVSSPGHKVDPSTPRRQWSVTHNEVDTKDEPHKGDHDISLPTSSDFSDDTPHDLEYGADDVSERLRRVSNAQNITVRAAWIHVLGDLVQSVGVMVAALIIFFKPQLKIIDPVCTFLFSILVLFTTINILRDTLYVLMEATPRGLEFNEVKDALSDIPGVVEVHNLRMWSLTMNKTAVSAHLALGQQAKSRTVLRQANQILRKRYLAHEVTIQLEQYIPEMSECVRCQEPMK